MRTHIQRSMYALALTLACSFSQAQSWLYYKDYPVNINPWDADYDNNNRIYMLTSTREVWMKNASDQWTQFADFPVANFFDLTVNKTTGTVYLADESQGLVYTSNQGGTWQQFFLQTNPNTGLHEAVLALSPVSDIGVFYGAGLMASMPFAPALIRYIPNGQTVQTAQIISYDPSNNNQSQGAAIWQTNDGGTLIVGTEGNGIWTSVNGGTTFQQTIGSGFKVYAFTEDNNGHFYALTTNLSNGNNAVYTSADAINWSVFATPPVAGESFTALFFNPDADELWIGTQANVYKVSDLQAPALVNQNLNHAQQHTVAFSFGNASLFQFSREFICEKLQSGNWQQTTTGLTGAATEAGFGINNQLIALNTTSTVISSFDGGLQPWENTLVPQDNNQAGISGLTISADGTAYFKSLNTGYRLAYGASEAIPIASPVPAANYLLHFYAAPDGDLYAVPSNWSDKLYRSSDNGANWQLILDLPNGFSSVASITEAANGTIYVSDVMVGNEIYYSSDNGTNWNAHTYDAQSDPDCMSQQPAVYTSGDHVFFVFCDKTFLFDGTGLTPVFFPNGSQVGPFITAGNDAFYTIYDNEVYTSADSGAVWTNIGAPAALSPYPNALYALLLNSDQQLFLQTSVYVPGMPGSVSGFYRYGTSAVHVDEHQAKVLRVYPNPVSEHLTIQFESAIRQVQLMHASGQICPVTVHHQTIDFSHQPSGVYILTVTDENGQQYQQKIVKK